MIVTEEVRRGVTAGGEAAGVGALRATARTRIASDEVIAALEVVALETLRHLGSNPTSALEMEAVLADVAHLRSHLQQTGVDSRPTHLWPKDDQLARVCAELSFSLGRLVEEAGERLGRGPVEPAPTTMLRQTFAIRLGGMDEVGSLGRAIDVLLTHATESGATFFRFRRRSPLVRQLEAAAEEMRDLAAVTHRLAGTSTHSPWQELTGRVAAELDRLADQADLEVQRAGA